MKDLTTYINESILDMDEEKADNAVEIDAIYHELAEEFGAPLVYINNSYQTPIERSNIKIKGNKLYFPDGVMLDLTIMPDTFRKYKIAPVGDLYINNYRGKTSKLPITSTDNLHFDNCSLDFDSKLKCKFMEFKNCGVENLKISSKQSCTTYSMDATTKYRIANKYISQLMPNAGELF
jgi:hypothetical protein